VATTLMMTRMMETSDVPASPMGSVASEVVDSVGVSDSRCGSESVDHGSKYDSLKIIHIKCAYVLEFKCAHSLKSGEHGRSALLVQRHRHRDSSSKHESRRSDPPATVEDDCLRLQALLLRQQAVLHGASRRRPPPPADASRRRPPSPGGSCLRRLNQWNWCNWQTGAWGMNGSSNAARCAQQRGTVGGPSLAYPLFHGASQTPHPAPPVEPWPCDVHG